MKHIANCVIFAAKLFIRRRRRMRKLGRKHLGSFEFRGSRHGPFFHCRYGRPRASGLIAVVSFVPVEPKHKKFPPPCFEGRVQWGDKP